MLEQASGIWNVAIPMGGAIGVDLSPARPFPVTESPMQSRPNPSVARTEFASVTGVPPYTRVGIRSRGGLKRTAFFGTIGRFATDYKLHNTYLKPDFITDPVEEYRGMREVAGLWDVTGEEVIAIEGPDAEALLDDLMPRDVRRMRDGHCYYSVLCHDHGGIVEDGVLVRFDRGRFWWVGGPGNSEEFLYGHAIGRNVGVESFNDRIHVASLQGPKSRDILQSVSDADLSGVPFYGLARAGVCGVPVTLTRTGYTAELGFDIYVDVERGERFFADLWAASEKAGAVLCGSRALGIRRIEAAILNFGQDFDWQHTPVEIGLGWMISESKGPYRARDALLKAKANPPRRRLAGLKLSGDEVPLIGDPILSGAERVGVVTSATGSPTLGHPIAIGWLGAGLATVGTRLEVGCDGRRLAAEVARMPFLDPDRRLSKA